MSNVLTFVPKRPIAQNEQRGPNGVQPKPQRIDPLHPDGIIAREVNAMHELMRAAAIARRARLSSTKKGPGHD